MIRFCECKAPYAKCDHSEKAYLILDKTIWQKGREYFAKYKEVVSFPVLNSTGKIICYAWQDQEAKREIRMLRELEEQGDAIEFHDLYPNYTEVTIHGCNELAWYMRKYLMKRGITVNVDGKFWKELGIMESKSEVPEYQNYEIWSEGIHQKSGDWKQERLRSSSVEFECVDKIYEANIKVGKIANYGMKLDEFLQKLRYESQIIIRGTGTMAQDAFDWLLSNGIEVCAFQSGRMENGRKRLFGKQILRKAEVEDKFRQAVILECGSQNSAWGFGDVDAYDYEGYERNKRYFLLRDYIEVPGNNLAHTLDGSRLIFTGDIYLCNRVFRWCTQHEVKASSIVYWNILEEDENKFKKFQIHIADKIELTEDAIVMLVMPQYSDESYLLKEVTDKKRRYIEKFEEYKVDNWSDYFSDIRKCIYLESEIQKFSKKELRPMGILLGVISPHSGNALVKESLSGHQQIILMQDYSFLNNELYYICIRLAEDNASDILTDFWQLYHSEMEAGWCFSSFYNGDQEKFNRKMRQLLAVDEKFTSQELFVMFHLAYEAMYGREIQSLENSIIYWEPHMWNREYVSEWVYWFHSKDVKCFMLNIIRNSYIRAGSILKSVKSDIGWQLGMLCIYNQKYVKSRILDNTYECTIRFEDLKSKPRKILTTLCKWLGICFDDFLMETTIHGEKHFYDGVITGFDLKPVYNLYEEFFSVFDRMRICMVNRSYQKENGYPYASCLDFSRRDLQELFLKEFRWEQLLAKRMEKTEDVFWIVQKQLRDILWEERFIELMEMDITETGK